MLPCGILRTPIPTHARRALPTIGWNPSISARAAGYATLRVGANPSSCCARFQNPFLCSAPRHKTTHVGLYGLRNARSYSQSPSSSPHKSAPSPKQTDGSEFVEDSESAAETTASGHEWVTTPSDATPYNLPELPAADGGLSEGITAAVSSVAPMQFGDITSLGLASWWSPVGIAQSAFEFIQVTTQLPPWASVFVFAGFFRLLLLPLSIKSLRFNANMNPHRPRFQELTKQLQEASRSPEGLMAASQEIRARHKELYREIGVSPSLAVFLFPVANITLAIGSFIAFERMARAFIPQLIVGGVWLWPNLCLPDPYLLIPIVSTLLVNVQMRLVSYDTSTLLSPMLLHQLNVFRLLSWAFIPFMSWIPTAALEYILASVTFFALQTFILLRPAVRLRLGIRPPINPNGPPPIRETFQVLRRDGFLKVFGPPVPHSSPPPPPPPPPAQRPHARRELKELPPSSISSSKKGSKDPEEKKRL